MRFIIGLIVTFAVFYALLYILSKVFKDFKIQQGQIISVVIVLIVVDYLLGFVLGIMAVPLKFITFGIFNFIINWIIYVLVMWVTDKVSQALEIKQTSTLLISGGVLSVAHAIINYFFR